MTECNYNLLNNPYSSVVLWSFESINSCVRSYIIYCCSEPSHPGGHRSPRLYQLSLNRDVCIAARVLVQLILFTCWPPVTWCITFPWKQLIKLNAGNEDRPRRAQLWHLLAVAKRPHNLPHGPRRRLHIIAGCRTASLPAVRVEQKTHPHVHQQSRGLVSPIVQFLLNLSYLGMFRQRHRRPSDLRHNAVRPASNLDVVRRPGLLNGQPPSGTSAKPKRELLASFSWRLTSLPRQSSPLDYGLHGLGGV